MRYVLKIIMRELEHYSLSLFLGAGLGSFPLAGKVGMGRRSMGGSTGISLAVGRATAKHISRKSRSTSNNQYRCSFPGNGGGRIMKVEKGIMVPLG
jgi:hypothetical protein